MIKATFYRDSDNNYKGFTVSGHAGYASAGKDIVCAGVSMLTINTINAVEKLTECRFKVEQDKAGTIKFKFLTETGKEPDSQGQLLISALSLGLTEIAKEYGDKHIQVYFKEV